MECKFEERKSGIEGKGIFAVSDIKKGEMVCEFKGDKVTIVELKEKYASGEERVDDPFQIDNDVYLDLYEPFVYFNHSCNPNAGIRGNGTMFALRDIKKDEEITFDYSSTEWTDDDAWGINWTEKWKMPCKCGSAGCRKEVRVFSLLPEKVKEKYRIEGALMDFILKKLSTTS
jgi:hypothetical protein